MIACIPDLVDMRCLVSDIAFSSHKLLAGRPAVIHESIEVNVAESSNRFVHISHVMDTMLSEVAVF